METTARNRTIGGIVIGAIILILLLVLFSCTVNSDTQSAPKKDPTTGESSLPSDPDTLEPDDKPSEKDSDEPEVVDDDIVPAANTGVTFIPAGNVPSGSTPTCELDPSACEDTRPPGAGVDICEIRPDLAQCQEPEPTPPPTEEEPPGEEDPGCTILTPWNCDDDEEDPTDPPTDDPGPPNCIELPLLAECAEDPEMGAVDCQVVSATELSLSWPAAKDDGEIDHYTVRGRPGIERQDTMSLGGTFTGLVPGTDYTFEVRATDKDGNNSEWSEKQCSTKPDTERPTKPAKLDIVHITSTTADLAWEPSSDDSGVDHYEISWTPVDGGRGGSGETEATETEFYVTDLEPETAYVFKVVAVDIVDKSSETASIEGKTLVEDTEAPGVPASVEVVNVDSDTVRVSWVASTDNQSRASAIRYDVVLSGPLFPARDSVTGKTSVMIDYVALFPGEITAAVTATDEAGNMSDAGTGTATAGERQRPGLRASTPGKAKSDAPADKPALPEAPVGVPTDEPTEKEAPLLPGLDDILPDGEDSAEAPAEEPAEPEATPSESESPAARPTAEEPADEATEDAPAEEDEGGLLDNLVDSVTTAVAAVF